MRLPLSYSYLKLICSLDNFYTGTRSILRYNNQLRQFSFISNSNNSSFKVFKQGFITNNELSTSDSPQKLRILGIAATPLTQSFFPVLAQVIRNLTYHHVYKPSPEKICRNLKFKVHYPEDGEYTTEHLPMTRLGGRDPDTGRLIYGKIGGGFKTKYRWVILNRLPEGSKDPLIEKVISVEIDPNRTARIALVGHEDKIRYIIATRNMEVGDIITSTRKLPRMSIRPKLGDAHPIGALPFGTEICCIEKRPGEGARLKQAAGASTRISRKVGDKLIIKVDKLKEFALDPNCLVTVGQVSNPDQNKIPIGSAQRARWLGIRPSSGLWQRKSGKHGRKIKKIPPIKHFFEPKPVAEVIDLNITGEGPRKSTIASTNRRS